jgi:hypothetical protein
MAISTSSDWKEEKKGKGQFGQSNENLKWDRVHVTRPLTYESAYEGSCPNTLPLLSIVFASNVVRIRYRTVVKHLNLLYNLVLS